MRNWMKQLGTRLSLVVSLGVSSTALAYPPQCVEVCSCEIYCIADCYEGTYRTTCGAAGALCTDACRVGSTQASLGQDAQEQRDAQEQQDASRDVCTEQAQRSASAES